MNRRRVGEDRGSKEMDGCPLTVKIYRDNTDNQNTTQTLEYTKDKYIIK
jgi:hypothetical protein